MNDTTGAVDRCQGVLIGLDKQEQYPVLAYLWAFPSYSSATKKEKGRLFDALVSLASKLARNSSCVL